MTKEEELAYIKGMLWVCTFIEGLTEETRAQFSIGGCLFLALKEGLDSISPPKE